MSQWTNQVGRTGYGNPPAYVEGQCVTPGHGVTRLYPVRRNAWTLEFAGDIGVGEVAATWTDPLGFAITVTIEIQDDGGLVAGVPDGEGGLVDPVSVTDAGDIADLWVAALLADSDALERVESATNDAGTVTVVGRVPGSAYTLGGEGSLTPVAEVIELTVTGTTDGLYRTAISVDGGAAVNVDFNASGNTATQIRDGLDTAFDALGSPPAVTYAANSTNKILVTSSVAGVPISVTITTPNSNANITQTNTVDNVSLELTAAESVVPNGGAIPFGRALVLDTIDGTVGVRLAEVGDTASMICGFVERPQLGGRPTGASINDVPALDAGSSVTPIERCELFAVTNSGDVAATVGGSVYVVLDDAGGDTLSTVRADADGGNAATPTRFTARWAEDVPAGALGLITLSPR